MYAIRSYYDHDGVFHGVVVEGEVVLLQHGQSLARGDDDIALVVLELARKYFQEGRLAGAVRADDPVAVARGEFQVNLFEEGLFGKGKGKVGYGNSYNFV